MPAVRGNDRLTMETAHRKHIDLGNPLRNLAGQPHYGRKPPASRVLNALLDAMSQFTGTCYMPVEKVVGGKTVAWNLMLNQCPGACGLVWKLVLKDRDVAAWLVNEINQRRVDRAND